MVFSLYPSLFLWVYGIHCIVCATPHFQFNFSAYVHVHVSVRIVSFGILPMRWSHCCAIAGEFSHSHSITVVLSARKTKQFVAKQFDIPFLGTQLLFLVYFSNVTNIFYLPFSVYWIYIWAPEPIQQTVLDYFVHYFLQFNVFFWCICSAVYKTPNRSSTFFKSNIVALHCIPLLRWIKLCGDYINTQMIIV